MVAGLKLKHKKASRHPARGSVAIQRAAPPSARAPTKIVNVETKPIPAARPSSPSTRLNALVQATNQIMVIRKLHQPSVGCPCENNTQHREGQKKTPPRLGWAPRPRSLPARPPNTPGRPRPFPPPAFA